MAAEKIRFFVKLMVNDVILMVDGVILIGDSVILMVDGVMVFLQIRSPVRFELISGWADIVLIFGKHVLK